jgi:hypothetical protein
MRKTAIFLVVALTFLAATLASAHGHGHVMGTVASVTAERIEVKTKDGKTVAVPLTAETKYLKGDQKATHGDVHVGERVVVHLAAGGAALEVHLPSGKATAKSPQ